jgi:UDP-N-acetylglucosamine 2-epimerase (non-hydrolysing)
LKVLNVVGARPNFVKMAPIVRAFGRRSDIVSSVLVHTWQHYDEKMAGSFFRELKLPEPEIDLGVGSGSNTAQTARVMLAFEPVLELYRPDWVLVVGDVNSTLACALVAARLGIRIAHVEAGLRSFDRGMPEEINRILTDQLADLLLTPSPDADANLLREGIAPEKIVCVGNVMVDTLFAELERAKRSPILSQLGVTPNGYAVLTLHRPVNVDDPVSLLRLLGTFGEVAARIPVIFPVHPRTRLRIAEAGLELPCNLLMIDPLGYHDFLQLWQNAKLVATDSGGLQEETTALGVPCLTLRENTERPVTVECGTSRLVGSDPQRIRAAIDDLLSGRQDRDSGFSQPRNRTLIPLWDGAAADRIVDCLIDQTRIIKGGRG